MSAAQVLAELRRRGIELIVEPERVRYRAPAGVMTPELRALIADCRPALLALLASEQRPRSAKCDSCGAQRLRANLTEDEDDGRLWCPECLYRRHEDELNRRRVGRRNDAMGGAGA